MGVCFSKPVLFFIQTVGMQIDEVQLPSSGLSVEVEPLPFERAGHEQQLLEEL